MIFSLPFAFVENKIKKVKQMTKKEFKRHYSRLCFEAALKSALYGLVIGFAANFLFAAIEWLFGFGSFWIAICVFAGTALVSGTLAYFLKLKPDLKETARRIDRFGLDERMITMLEYENDDSYIASLQRENARAHYERVKDKKLKLRLSSALIVIAVVATLLGSSMTTVVALADSGIIPDGSTLINPEDPYEDYIPVSYIVEEGGYISGGEEEQLVSPGGDADPVVAIPEEGWMFVGWDDESTDPSRHDKNITEPMEFIAIFEQLEEDENGEMGGSEGPNSEGEEGDSADDQPSQDGSESSKGESGENGEQSDDKENSEGENDGNQDSDDRGEGSGNNNDEGNGAGGKWEETNMIYDGKTYYKDTLDYYYEYSQQIFEEHGEIPPELREFFELYYDSI